MAVGPRRRPAAGPLRVWVLGPAWEACWVRGSGLWGRLGPGRAAARRPRRSPRARRNTARGRPGAGHGPQRPRAAPGRSSRGRAESYPPRHLYKYNGQSTRGPRHIVIVDAYSRGAAAPAAPNRGLTARGCTTPHTLVQVRLNTCNKRLFTTVTYRHNTHIQHAQENRAAHKSPL